MPTKTRTIKQLLRWISVVAIGSLFVLAGYILYLLSIDNFHEVVLGQLYRSGQMDGTRLSDVIRRYDIKCVLNLRGENTNAGWHQAELATVARLNVVHYDRSLGSGTPLTLDQMDELVRLLRQAPKPVLIHCDGGADRSGLVSALYCFAIDGEPPEKADQQLTVWYGHIPLIRPKVTAMDRSFWGYISNSVHAVSH